MSMASAVPDQVIIHAPAKLNLGLRIIGKREDGFHDLETIFVAVHLYDELTVRRLHSGPSTLAWSPAHQNFHAGDFRADASNLILRAIRLAERHTGIELPIAVNLLKRIPVAAGLGGGSSDAAATLLALSLLYPDRVPQSSLTEWASQLGSDIPFFLGCSIAFGTGRGEILRPYPLDREWVAVMICPPFGSSTTEVYQALDLTRDRKMGDFPVSLDGEGIFASLARLYNDLEGVVLRRIPALGHWQSRLSAHGAMRTFVSGSGPTVYGVFREQPDLQQIGKWNEEGVQVFVVRPVGTERALVIA